MIRKLQIMQDAVEDMTFQEIKKIYPKKSKDAKVYILIRLKSNHERDMIMSHASNLPKDCSIETVIPDHLSSLKSLLDGHAYKFRARARDEGGKVSTSVRLDELSNSLVLAVRKEKGNWRSYNQEELRLMEEEREREEEEDDEYEYGSDDEDDEEDEEMLTPRNDQETNSRSRSRSQPTRTQPTRGEKQKK